MSSRVCALFAAVALAACSTSRGEGDLVGGAGGSFAAAPEAALAHWVPPSALNARPAAVPMPQPPPPQRDDRRTRLQSGVLGNNAAVTGVLPERGVRASFDLEIIPGEQALFEIAGFGYERGASGRVRFVLTDAKGEVVLEETREVGTVWRAFLPYARPGFSFSGHSSNDLLPGSHRCTLEVLSGSYRFVLVRHSDFASLGVDPIDLADRERVHGHLPRADAVARFRVPVAAGEELALKLSGTREAARNEARRGGRGRRGAEGARALRMEGMQPQGGFLFQQFVLEASLDGHALGEPGSFVRLTAPRPGVIDVAVRARFPGDGGLFDLAIERGLEPVAVRGVVVDRDDVPLDGVTLRFLRDPDGDLVGSALTDESGAFASTVLPGDLTVRLVRDGRPARAPAHVRIDADGVFDFLYLPAKRRGDAPAQSAGRRR